MLQSAGSTVSATGRQCHGLNFMKMAMVIDCDGSWRCEWKKLQKCMRMQNLARLHALSQREPSAAGTRMPEWKNTPPKS